ncbi:MAG TPA: class B sortase, partial [Clostridia bacterium]|nr:class B sortase [Clostridia bacterium]
MRRKKRHGISVSLIIITATSLVLTLSTLGYYLLQYRESDLLNDKIVEIAFGDEKDTDTGTSNQTPNGSIDHAALFDINNDYAGWLMVEGTEISLPIVYHAQEQYYLRRDFDEKRNVAGTLFLDYKNNKDFSDTNTMIFGHNMKNGSMFA